MKTVLLSVALVALVRVATAQGTLVFDQQSGDESLIREGAVNYSQGPLQSFTPTLGSVGFVRLYMTMFGGANGLSVNLRSGSPSGPLLGSTLEINQTGSYTGTLTFFFPTAVPVTPGTTYFFEPVVRQGNPTLNASQFYGYSGGMLLFADGTTSPTYDLWFREGIVVPEPGTFGLVIMAVAACAWRRLSSR